MKLTSAPRVEEAQSGFKCAGPLLADAIAAVVVVASLLGLASAASAAPASAGSGVHPISRADEVDKIGRATALLPAEVGAVYVLNGVELRRSPLAKAFLKGWDAGARGSALGSARQVGGPSAAVTSILRERGLEWAVAGEILPMFYILKPTSGGSVDFLRALEELTTKSGAHDGFFMKPQSRDGMFLYGLSRWSQSLPSTEKPQPVKPASHRLYMPCHGLCVFSDPLRFSLSLTNKAAVNLDMFTPSPDQDESTARGFKELLANVPGWQDSTVEVTRTGSWLRAHFEFPPEQAEEIGKELATNWLNWIQEVADPTLKK